MVVDRLRYGLIVLLTVATQSVFAQAHLASEIGVNKNSVYVGEPVEVSVTVFTSTWFTKGINPGNIKVNGAFTIYFRGVSISIQRDGKTYAGVEMIFNVFPYRNEDITFPSLDIKVETPDEGGYKGISRTVRTKSKTISVKSIPAGYDINRWLVSSNVTVKDNWTGNRNDVKVGDVLERTITLTAAGTVSGLLPEITFDSIPDVSSYPTGSTAENIRTNTSISAKRSDGTKYLFEKEGVVTIPAIEIVWWNAAPNRLYKRTLKEFTIDVKPNPDLGMIESIQDSLALLSVVDSGVEKEESNLFFGLTKKQIVYLILFFVIVLYLYKRVFRWVIMLREFFVEKRSRYRQTEKYFFNRFIKTAKSKQSDKTINALYLWLDKLKLEEPTLKFFAGCCGDEQLLKDILLTEQVTINNERKLSLVLKCWIRARKKYLKNMSGKTDGSRGIWINP